MKPLVKDVQNLISSYLSECDTNYFMIINGKIYLTKYPYLQRKCVNHCAQYGYLSVLIYFEKYRFAKTSQCLWLAAKHNCMNIVQHLVVKSSFTYNDVGNFVSAAVGAGHYQMAMYLLYNRYACPKYIIDDAVRGNNIELVKHFIANDYKVGEVTLFNAVINNNLDIIKLIVENGGYCDKYTFYTACKIGNYEVIKYLHSVNHDSGQKVLIRAAESNDIKIVEFLHNSGYSWNAEACTIALKNGNLEIINYAYQNNLEINIHPNILQKIIN